ncbi:MAG: class I SAM-dependent methyltransferase [Actinomycetota bacterium]
MEPWSDRAADLYEFVFSREDAHRNAERLHRLIEERTPGCQTLLDVACGTGWHLERLRDWYHVEGLDSSLGMLRHARQRLPDVPLHQADMRTFDLGRSFDVVVCLSSSIAWMQTKADLADAVGAMSRHLNQGGLLMIEPWGFPEDANDEPWLTTIEADDRAVALMETTTLHADTWRQETHYLTWTPDGGIDYLTETHTFGAFTKADHEAAFGQAGLSVGFDPDGLLGRGLFIGARRRS